MATVIPIVTVSQQALADLIEANPDSMFHELQSYAMRPPYREALRKFMSSQKFGLLISQLIEFETIQQDSDTYQIKIVP